MKVSCFTEIYHQWIPSKHEALNQRWVNVGPPSTTSGQHWPNIGSMPRVCWERHRRLFCRTRVSNCNCSLVTIPVTSVGLYPANSSFMLHPIVSGVATSADQSIIFTFFFWHLLPSCRCNTHYWFCRSNSKCRHVAVDIRACDNVFVDNFSLIFITLCHLSDNLQG